jgi:membrane protease YdiL (CAAX protease family)
VSVRATKGEVSSERRAAFAGRLSAFVKASTPGPDHPLWTVWYLAFAFWLFDILIRAGVGIFRLTALRAYPPEKMPPTLRLPAALLLDTPLVADLVTLVLLYLFVTELRRRPFLDALRWNFRWTATPNVLGKKRVIPFASVVLGLAGATLVIIAGSAFQFVPGPETLATKHFNSSPLTRHAVSLSAVIGAPLIEELLYRGVLYGAFRRALGKLVAFALVVAAFTLVHWDQSGDGHRPHWGAILTITMLGIICTGLRAYTDRIAPAFFAHLGYNLYIAVTRFCDCDPVWLLMKRFGGWLGGGN